MSDDIQWSGKPGDLGDIKYALSFEDPTPDQIAKERAKIAFPHTLPVLERWRLDALRAYNRGRIADAI
jgi:hypothetical protein